MYKNGFSSSTTATNNVMTAVPVFPTAGPPAQTMGGPMILTPAPGNYGNILYIYCVISLNNNAHVRAFF